MIKKFLIRSILFIVCGTSSAYAELVFEKPPENYNPKVEVAACFIHVDGRVLFLKRLPHKSEGNTWGIPGGKLEKGESPKKAVIREIQEETGIQLPKDSIQHLGTVYIRYPKVDFTYHMFEFTMQDYPAEVVISAAEHTEYRWLTMQEALDLTLIPGEDECIHLAYGKNFKEKRT